MNQLIVILFILLALNGLMVWKVVSKLWKEIERLDEIVNGFAEIGDDNTKIVQEWGDYIQSQIKKLNVDKKK